MIELTTSQHEAMETLSAFLKGETDYQTVTLRGPAGTGKTVLTGIVALKAQRLGLTVGVAAPTNKAVRVLREKIQEAGATLADSPILAESVISARRGGPIDYGSIHSFLGLRLVEHEDGEQSCVQAGEPRIASFSILIVDEASMVGQSLFDMIEEERGNTKILFVGDPAQLPPIEQHSKVSPAFTKTDKVLSLTEIVRQAEGNPIIHLATDVRKAIKEKVRVDPRRLLRVAGEVPGAGVTLHKGGNKKAAELALDALRDGQDARIVAYTNRSVLYYNKLIHETLYGKDSDLFGLGERVIVHQQHVGMAANERNVRTGKEALLVTNEEGVIVNIEEERHPCFKRVPSWRVLLRTDPGEYVSVYVPCFPDEVEAKISGLFREWRTLKAEGKSETAKEKSGQAWAMRKAFAPLRHAYSLTSHKSQGSTFDTAIIDFINLDQIKTDFAFNRGLYVAITRPRYSLHVVYE